MLLLLESEVPCYFAGMEPEPTLQKGYVAQLSTTLTSVVTMLTEKMENPTKQNLRRSDT